MCGQANGQVEECPEIVDRNVVRGIRSVVQLQMGCHDMAGIIVLTIEVCSRSAGSVFGVEDGQAIGPEAVIETAVDQSIPKSNPGMIVFPGLAGEGHH